MKSDLFYFPYLLFSALLIALGGKMSLRKKITRAAVGFHGRKMELSAFDLQSSISPRELPTSWKTLDAKIILPWRFRKRKGERTDNKNLEIKTMTLYAALKY